MRGRRRPEPLPAPVAYHQHFASGASPVYLTAALYRVNDTWVVVAVDGEFRGEYEITVHERLEDARRAIVAWVGEVREVGRDNVPPSIHRKFEHWERYQELDSDVL